MSKELHEECKVIVGSDNEHIYVRTTREKMNGEIQTIVSGTIDLTEEKIRNELIKLGWTPPSQTPEVVPMNKELLESEEFYSLMQAYRHAPINNQAGVTQAYEDVKKYLLSHTVVPVCNWVVYKKTEHMYFDTYDTACDMVYKKSDIDHMSLRPKYCPECGAKINWQEVEQ